MTHVLGDGFVGETGHACSSKERFGGNVGDTVCGKCGKWISKHPGGVSCIPNVPKTTAQPQSANTRKGKRKSPRVKSLRETLNLKSQSVRAVSAGLPGHGKRR